MNKHIILCGNTAWGMFNFRQGLINALLDKGNTVTVVAPKDDFSQKLKNLGCDVVYLEISGKGMNPFEDLRLILSLTKLYRDLKPDFIFHYTIKPNIYGSMAARFARVPSIAVTTGLGYTFQASGLVAIIARFLYRVAFSSPEQVWFLNQDDLDIFLKAKLITTERARLLDSEGVNTEYFTPRSRPTEDGKTRFLLIARMLWDKGVGEFVQAARKLHAKYPDAIFQLLGEADASNPQSISREKIAEWEKEGVIEYLGITNDVRPYIAAADCVVLPSYREGVPRILLEAASMEKSIITTDSVGCRETVKVNETGWLCAPKSVDSLTASLKLFLALPIDKRKTMEKESRNFIKGRFDEKLVVGKYLSAIK